MHHDASWCIMMHHDRSWCIMNHDASRSILMHHESSWCICIHHACFLYPTSMDHECIMIDHDANAASWSSVVHHAAWYIMINHDASWYTMVHHDANTPLELIFHDASWCVLLCIIMSHDYSWWLSWRMHRDVSWCIMMQHVHHDVIQHHDVSWCIMMQHDASCASLRCIVMVSTPRGSPPAVLIMFAC